MGSDKKYIKTYNKGKVEILYQDTLTVQEKTNQFIGVCTKEAFYVKELAEDGVSVKDDFENQVKIKWINFLNVGASNEDNKVFINYYNNFIYSSNYDFFVDNADHQKEWIDVLLDFWKNYKTEDWRPENSSSTRVRESSIGNAQVEAILRNFRDNEEKLKRNIEENEKEVKELESKIKESLQQGNESQAKIHNSKMVMIQRETEN